LRALLALVRVLIVGFSIVVFLGHMALVRLLVRKPWERVRWSNRILGIYSHFGLWVLRLKVNVLGAENLQGLRGGLMVGNHLGYMDVLAISSVRPSCFVTSQEIRETPGLGIICQMAGCLFVERRNKLNIHNEVSELRDALQVGLSVVIFPEATSTNGEQIKKFKRPLFVSAIDSGAAVAPFCMNYRRVGGQPISVNNRDNIMWYGDMDFMPHLWALATCGGVELDLHFLPPIHTDLSMTATGLSEQTQAVIETIFIPITNAEGSHKPLPLSEPLKS
jgi:1-acyl-sn-glycerol-3-phosphate acyltransferase